MPAPVQPAETFADLHALIFEARRDNAATYLVLRDAGIDPAPAMTTDRRLIRADEVARRGAAEASGITYIDRNQLDFGMAVA
jgi:hypothetical protein